MKNLFIKHISAFVALSVAAAIGGHFLPNPETSYALFYAVGIFHVPVANKIEDKILSKKEK